MDFFLKLCFLLIIFSTATLHAAPSSFVYNGRIIKPDLTDLEDSSVDFIIKVLSTSNECLLYEETHTLDMTASKGFFSLNVGAGTDTTNGNFSSEVMAFDNSLSNQTGLSCAVGTSYDPVPGDTRKLIISFDEGLGFVGAQSQIIQSVPYAQYAGKIGGKSSDDLLINKLTDNLTQSNLESLFAGTAYAALSSLIAGTSNLYAPLGTNGSSAVPGFTTGTPPVAPSAGDMWYDTTSNQLKFYDGSVTKALGTAADTLDSVTDNGNTTTNSISVGELTSTQNITMSGTGALLLAGGTDAERPGAPINGMIRYNTTGSKLEGFESGSWQDLVNASGAGDITDVTTNSGSGLSGGASNGAATLQVVVDGSSVEISTNTIQVKDLGITNAKLAATGLDVSKFTTGTLGNARLPADVSVDSLTLANGIKVGSVATACNSSAVGIIRYNSGTRKVQFCSGSVWLSLKLDLPDPPTCPTDYVPVYADGYYTQAGFCIMKYQAKAETNAGGVYDADGIGVVLGSYKPASVSTDLPWREINRDDARTECQSLGAGYDLTSNAQWQAIARDMEVVGANWTSGTVGSGCMFQGNNGEATCGYDGANPEPFSSNARGIFTLSTSETIYDFAGNVWEWVLDDNATNYGANAYFSAVTSGTHSVTGTLGDGIVRAAKDQFGPSGSYSPANNNSGLGFGWMNASAGAILRGGSWPDTTTSGIFSMGAANGPTDVSSSFGFRCVYAP